MKTAGTRESKITEFKVKSRVRLKDGEEGEPIKTKERHRKLKTKLKRNICSSSSLSLEIYNYNVILRIPLCSFGKPHRGLQLTASFMADSTLPLLLTRSFAGHSAGSRPARPSGLFGVTGVLPPRAVHAADRAATHTEVLSYSW